MICADRWLRGVEEVPIQQGAWISFELSDNSDCEWVGPLGWYWYVPRALRNSVWVDITLAVAQVVGSADTLISRIREARERGADLVAFPARAIGEDALPAMQAAARENQITVVVGMEYSGSAGVPPASGTGGRDARAPRNSAFVIGPDGAVLTRYDQLSASSPHQPGTDPRAMWFRVKGVPAVVTIGRDALWTELAELASVVGAQLYVHLDDDRDNAPGARLRRVQVWSNMASFKTFTAAANVVDSGIWDDLSGREEVRHAVRGTPKPDNGPIEIYSDFSVNLVLSATADQPLIIAKRRVLRINPHHPARTSNMNPQMDPWYRIGAAIIRPK